MLFYNASENALLITND